jgi:Protein of unknown function (DUF3551)
MRRMFIAAAVALAATAVAQPAPAYEAPWCAVHSFGRNGAYWECQFQTLEQCIPWVIAGNRGFCNPNPAYVGPAPAKRAKVRHHRRRARR